MIENERVCGWFCEVFYLEEEDLGMVSFVKSPALLGSTYVSKWFSVIL